MSKTTSSHISRRNLLQGAALAFPMIVSARALGLQGTAASQRIRMGFIGVGSHGLGYNLASFLPHEDAQVVAVCDVFGGRREKAKDVVDKHNKNVDCRMYADFRQLLAQKDIDAVCISTPDHWHVPISMAALAAGKDVMCEKPTLTIAQGRDLVELATQKKAVYQVGLEDRSVIQYYKLAEWVRNGAIGELKKISCGLPAGSVVAKEEPIAPPPDLDWNMWLGQAPMVPYTRKRTEPMVWRQIRDYSGGMLTDWGAHILDTAQVANFAEESGPVEIEGKGDVPANAMTTTPVTFKLTYRYANGVEMEVTSGKVFIKFEGSKGWVGNTNWRGKLEASDEALLHIKYEREGNKIWPMPPGEHRDFLNCVKSRKPTTYTAEHGQRLSTALHLGAIAMELKRKVKWDPKTEAFVGDEEANKLRTREARDWTKA